MLSHPSRSDCSLGKRTSRSCLIVAGLTLFAFLTTYPNEPVPAEGKADRMSYLDNGLIKIGVALDRGGSIGYLADSKKSDNVVNIHDLGRWIGQSYYSGPKPFGDPHPDWKDWPWNPVSAGDVYDHPCKLLDHRNDGKILYVKATPMQWALKNVPADCSFETWVTLDSRTAQVRHRLTNQRKDPKQYPAMDQELPAVYTVGKLHRLFTYDGDQPFTQAPVREVPKQPARDGRPQWSKFWATEHWAALLDDDDWGLGVFHPGVYRFLGGFSGKANTGGPTDDPTGYLAPVRQEVLDQNIVYEYRYTLILDSLANIRRHADDHRPKGNLPDYRFTKDRQHWWFVNAEDTGTPVDGCLRLKVEKDDPQMIGPDGFWDAKDVPKLFIRAAHHTKQSEAELFWQTKEKSGFGPDRRVSFTVQPDGRFHTYEIDLSGVAGYRGKITGLRFDPVDSGRQGELVDVAFISHRQGDE